MNVTVIKIGGSLLSLPNLPERLRRLIADFKDDRVLLVVGGGAAADVVRQWDQIHELSPEQSHWLAIDSLSLTARLLAELLAEVRVVSCHEDAEACWIAGHWPVLEPRTFLRSFEALHGPELPRSWTVTSDSIAAWLAIHWPAQRLVLVKSVDLSHTTETDGAVDEFFSSLLPRLPNVEWVNLRLALSAAKPDCR